MRGTIAAVVALASVAAAPMAHGAYNGPPPGEQRTCTTASTGGAWSVTWKAPFKSAKYPVQATGYNAATAPQQTVCGVNATTANTASGTCSTTQSTSIVVGGLTNPLVAAGAISVCVSAGDTTQ